VTRAGSYQSAFRQRLDEEFSVWFGDDSRVEAYDGAVVGARANEPAEALLELDHGFGQLVVAERIAAGGADRV
jgi:hypothetical protein